MRWVSLTTRLGIIGEFLSERLHHGLPNDDVPVGREVVLVLDGVGGLQLAPALVRRALRDNGDTTPVLMHRWQFGVVGEILTDLMWSRRNRLMGMKLARRILAFKKANPDTHIHLVAYSGGCGIAVYACEKLQRIKPRRSEPRTKCNPDLSGVRADTQSNLTPNRNGRSKTSAIDTLLLISPSLSPQYNLGPALGCVQRCYSLVSQHDNFFLGWGTRTFGTTDRKLTDAAGKIGFRIPDDADEDERRRYERMHEIHWSQELEGLHHAGGHTGWIAVPFLRKHLMPMLHGSPRLPLRPIPPASEDAVVPKQAPPATAIKPPAGMKSVQGATAQ